MDSHEPVDYRLLRQKQQEERFRARGATWKPSGKACTLQFVFDEEPKRPIEAKGQIWSIGAPPKVPKVKKPVATSISAQSMLAGQPSQSTGKTRRVKPVNAVVLAAALSLQSDEQATLPPKPHKPKAVVESPRDHLQTKKTRAKDSRSASQSNIAEIAVTIASPVPGLDVHQASTSKLARKRTKKEIAKTSSDPPLSTLESPGPGKEVTTVASLVPQRSVKPRRPKKVEQTIETKEQPGGTESKYRRPKKRAKPMLHDEDSEEDIELSQNSHISRAKVTVTSVSDPPNGGNAQPSKKRRILADDGAQQWSMLTTQSGGRKTTIHFGLPLGGAR